MYEKIILVTRKTRLEELIERFNSKGQAKFYIEHSGGNFQLYEKEHTTYYKSLDQVFSQLGSELKVQKIDRSFVPNMKFEGQDIVLALGQDGVVANTAKYIGQQPLIGINPDPERYDGILLPFQPSDVKCQIQKVIEEQAAIIKVTLAEASLDDGQKLLAFNDLFLGPKSHISARYRIKFENSEEVQSSSGIIVSTGAGSTGWMSSIFNMARGIHHYFGDSKLNSYEMEWSDERLMFAVREPFISKHSNATLAFGFVDNKRCLEIESRMPMGGVIFSDGIESDFLDFNSGSSVTIKPAKEKAHLVVREIH